MPAQASARPPSGNYVFRIAAIVRDSLRRLARAPSHSRKAEARRRLARRWLMLIASAAFVIIGLMLTLDATAIGLMYPRGTASLWPVRIFTEFAKASYVLWALVACLALLLLVLPTLRGVSRSIASSFGTRLLYVFLSVFAAVTMTEILKPLFGRGRPFVGDIGVMNFSPFAGTQAFASLPSGHATTSFALAFAVSAVWPRLAPAMWTYAVLICVSRVVLLAHHPSDTIAGALVGVVGAMAVRYWFAARKLGFTIAADGTIVTLEGPSWAALKRVARSAIAP